MRDGFAVDKWLLLPVAALLALGVTMVLSTSYLYSQERFTDGTYFFRKQLIAVGAGEAALITCCLLPSAPYRTRAYPLWGLTFRVLLLYLMLFVGGARLPHLLATGLLALPVLLYVMLKAEYRLRRLLTFMDPWREASSSGFQVVQSLIAFGSGELWGRGLGESRQK